MITLPGKEELVWVLRGAAKVDGAVGAVLFRYREDEHRFEVVVSEGLPETMLEFAKSLSPGDGTATGDAVIERRRVVIRDVSDEYHGQRREAALAAGIRAVYAVPLFGHDRRINGVFTVYYDVPHHPSRAATERIGEFTEVASLLTQLAELVKILRRNDAESGIRDRRLSPQSRQDAENARTLLGVCDREAVTDRINRKLRRIIAEVSSLVEKSGAMPPIRRPTASRDAANQSR